MARRVSVTLSEQSLKELRLIDQDVQVMIGLQDELVERMSSLLAKIEREAIAEVPLNDGEVASGVRVFDTDVTPEPLEPEPEPPTVAARGTAIPPVMNIPATGNRPSTDPDRIRDSPFTRAPRQVQVDWLIGVLREREWVAPILLAREVANDERHFRYLRHALSGRLREMHEEGIVHRRDSHVKGSMYEYCLIGDDKRP